MKSKLRGNDAPVNTIFYEQLSFQIGLSKLFLRSVAVNDKISRVQT